MVDPRESIVPSDTRQRRETLRIREFSFDSAQLTVRHGASSLRLRHQREEELGLLREYQRKIGIGY